MIRFHVFASFLAAGTCLTLFAPGLCWQREPGWDARESSSTLFAQETRADGRAAFMSTSRTVAEWERPRSLRAVGIRATDSKSRTGARLSLVSYRTVSSTLTTCDPGPDIAPLDSVTTSGGTTGTCSATKTPAYLYTDSCSVQTATTMPKPTCSTNTVYAYCSTNVNNAVGPGTCSASGLATGGGVNYCSAASGTAATTAKCSTQANFNQQNGNTSYNCSVGVTAPSTKSRCSVGSYASSNPTSPSVNQCSAFTGNLNGGTQTNQCSVILDGGAANGASNLCSTDGSDNNNCSTFGMQGAGLTSDFCSVVSNAFTNAQCTVFPPATGTGTCSAHPAATGNCSVLTATGVKAPQLGVCGTQH